MVSFVLSINISFFSHEFCPISFAHKPKEVFAELRGRERILLGAVISHVSSRDAASWTFSSDRAHPSHPYPCSTFRVIGVQSIFHAIKIAKRNAAVMSIVGQCVLTRAAKREIGRENGYRRFANESLIILKGE